MSLTEGQISLPPRRDRNDKILTKTNGSNAGRGAKELFVAFFPQEPFELHLAGFIYGRRFAAFVVKAGKVLPFVYRETLADKIERESPAAFRLKLVLHVMCFAVFLQHAAALVVIAEEHAPVAHGAAIVVLVGRVHVEPLESGADAKTLFLYHPHGFLAHERVKLWQ